MSDGIVLILLGVVLIVYGNYVGQLNDDMREELGDRPLTPYESRPGKWTSLLGTFIFLLGLVSVFAG